MSPLTAVIWSEAVLYAAWRDRNLSVINRPDGSVQTSKGLPRSALFHDRSLLRALQRSRPSKIIDRGNQKKSVVWRRGWSPPTNYPWQTERRGEMRGEASRVDLLAVNQSSLQSIQPLNSWCYSSHLCPFFMNLHDQGWWKLLGWTVIEISSLNLLISSIFFITTEFQFVFKWIYRTFLLFLWQT